MDYGLDNRIMSTLNFLILIIFFKIAKENVLILRKFIQKYLGTYGIDVSNLLSNYSRKKYT